LGVEEGKQERETEISFVWQHSPAREKKKVKSEKQGRGSLTTTNQNQPAPPIRRPSRASKIRSNRIIVALPIIVST
jgi:hypothetical protein